MQPHRWVIVFTIGLLCLLAMPEQTQAQLLEDRGKLKLSKKERKGFFHFLKKNNTKSRSGVEKFQNRENLPPNSPVGDRQFTGRKNRVPSTYDHSQSKSFTPVIHKLGSKPGDHTYKISERHKLQGSNFQPYTLFYQGDMERLKKGAEHRYKKELAKSRSGVVIAVPKPDYSPSDDTKYKGFDKGKNKRGKRFYYSELSRQFSGTVIDYTPVVMEHNKTHKYKGNTKRRTKWAYVLYQKDNSRATAKFTGVKVTSYNDKIADFNKTAAQNARYTGTMKVAKRNNKMHPSASYVYGKRAGSYEDKELFRKLNMYWVRINGNKVQPESVKESAPKNKFDKKEKDLWNY